MNRAERGTFRCLVLLALADVALVVVGEGDWAWVDGLAALAATLVAMRQVYLCSGWRQLYGRAVQRADELQEMVETLMPFRGWRN